MERLQFIIALSSILSVLIGGIQYLNKENKAEIRRLEKIQEEEIKKIEEAQRKDRLEYLRILLVIMMDSKPHLSVEIFALFDEYKALGGNGYVENEFNQRKQKYYDKK